MDVAKKENLKRETESLLIVAENKAISTSHIKARVDKTLKKTVNVGYMMIGTKLSIT